MKCNEALARMLDAEPADFTGAGELAMHIAACSRCSAVAGMLRSETQRLAGALAGAHTSLLARRSRRDRVNRNVIAPVVLLAASIVLIVAVRGNVEPVAAPQPEVVSAHMVVPAASAAPVQRETTHLAVDAPRRFEVAALPVAAPIQVQPAAPETAPSSLPDETAEVTVTTEPGTRATIMRAKEARVTVVWIHSD